MNEVCWVSPGGLSHRRSPIHHIESRFAGASVSEIVWVDLRSHLVSAVNLVTMLCQFPYRAGNRIVVFLAARARDLHCSCPRPLLAEPRVFPPLPPRPHPKLQLIRLLNSQDHCLFLLRHWFLQRNQTQSFGHVKIEVEVLLAC